MLERRALSRPRAAHVRNPLPDPSGRDSPAAPPRASPSGHLLAGPQELTETEAEGGWTVSTKGVSLSGGRSGCSVQMADSVMWWGPLAVAVGTPG